MNIDRESNTTFKHAKFPVLNGVGYLHSKHAAIGLQLIAKFGGKTKIRGSGVL